MAELALAGSHVNYIAGRTAVVAKIATTSILDFRKNMYGIVGAWALLVAYQMTDFGFGAMTAYTISLAAPTAFPAADENENDSHYLSSFQLRIAIIIPHSTN